MLLAIGDKYPGDYDDGRFTTDAENVKGGVRLYDDVKNSLDCNLGRMPVLSVATGHGKDRVWESVGQSAAINFYLATEFDLMGDTTMEAAQIIGFGEHISEMRKAYYSLIPYGTPADEEKLALWFDGGCDAEPANSPADMSKRAERQLKWWLGRIELVCGDKGFAVGSRMSLADVLVYNALAETLLENEAKEGTPSAARECFTSKERTDAALAPFPKLRAIIAAVAGVPQIQKWLAERGVQAF